ncbi:UNVERIFIED_CONTAM: Z1 domain-containing protein [Acinetobacter baumannii]|uniref:Z1 domain-containing protein n=2 Tax=Acinetobacter baumannii TaxID=470 RepID=UPI000DE72D43|nr:Z1 domain-containing protein [Acinetobacter baumannii]EHU2105374.1 DEAD/DEAH box helicase [Acinetobacter baumannii]EKV2799453.1 DEAD/DEAH box helicase [Acinetobacter baumannii]MCZ3028623.1 Z1 domain-containing protein [Acinetobacter baumannii]MDC5352986.1 Z1 domain-containing protein [Acinetobacter baumannii]MDV7650220.1 Z1 domain-containing protein [Acinetobacter baumannii]
MYLENYLDSIPASQRLSTKVVAENFLEKLTRTNCKQKVRNTLLLGNVQSGKTGKILGLISSLADANYKFFIYLTTDSVDLQKQTLDRIKSNLNLFSVLSENDIHNFDTSFRSNKPIILVIKKNSRILRKWRDTLSSKSYLSGYPLIIIDDEADAASLNTKVNTPNKKSTVNHLLNDIKNTGNQSIFIEVTATPQAILLQSDDSDWHPEFIQYFEPGDDYVSGNFVFTEPESFITRYITEELEDTKDESSEIPEGLDKALKTFIVTCAEFYLLSQKNCNFIVHPSIRVNDHQAFANKIIEHLNVMAFALNDGLDLSNEFLPIWNDLKATKPDINHFEDIYQVIVSFLESQTVNVIVLNSKTESNFDISTNYNIIIGGNIISRGLTIPKLQTVYYSRMSKKPNADTFWQHSRIFGYDREKSLLRLFMPQNIYKFFTELNNANNLLIKQSTDEEQSNIQIIYPKNIQPTRKNILDNKSLRLIAGGKNYFPNSPNQRNLEKVNFLLNDLNEDFHQEAPDLYQIDSDLMLSLLEGLGEYDKWDWDLSKYISCINALKSKRPSLRYYLLIRHNRQISKGTGTMLSPNDRKIGDNKPDDLILTLYQVTGDIKFKWDGKPFWLPNIKFPRNMLFWDIDTEKS